MSALARHEEVMELEHHRHAPSMRDRYVGRRMVDQVADQDYIWTDLEQSTLEKPL
jgi:hypothetical protein